MSAPLDGRHYDFLLFRADDCWEVFAMPSDGSFSIEFALSVPMESRFETASLALVRNFDQISAQIQFLLSSKWKNQITI